ncbi:YesL family protein [Tuberibacillus sp. Marseille-P3662]|uniref:YesL family protein n=1 Tax=Tuberibacillus sp. Marseille-P3662 TaxID=1965358 RepID=UPI000A1CDCB7|nr:YesL family protein [Tuberibacillus sp. Marseille-P3662]
MNHASGVIYNAMEWLTRFAYINLLWGLFSLLGGLIFGFFPATTAMFTLVREWLKGNADIPIFPSFWKHYRSEFIKSNLLGLFIALIGIMIYIDVRYIQLSLNTMALTYIPLFAFMLLFILFLLYIFPAFVHYDLKVPQVIKNAFFIMLIHPLHNLFMVISLVAIFFVMKAIPALAFIFGGSTYAFITMWMCLNAFNKISRKAHDKQV